MFIIVITSLAGVVEEENKINISEKEPVDCENDNTQENPENDSRNLLDIYLINEEINIVGPDPNLENNPRGSRANGTEMQITTNWDQQYCPALYGDRIVWTDARNGNSDLYMYDLGNSTEMQITTNSDHQYYPAIYGDRIVWQDDRNGYLDIYMYDLGTSKETQITTNLANQYYPAIYGDRIVWLDDRNGQNIYMYDLGTSKETKITSSDDFPAIYGDRIVWSDRRTGDSDIYMYDLGTSKETQITSNPSYQYYPIINGDRIVWVDDRNGNMDIYMYDLGTSKETRITSNPANQTFPAIYCNWIVWSDWRNDADGGWANGGGIDGINKVDVYYYDLGTGIETQITTSSSVIQYRAAIHDCRIVWSDNRNGNFDIFMYQIETPPTINYLNVSKPFVYRPDEIEIYSEATDFEDHERELTPYFEYLIPGKPEWSRDLLGPPIYTNERWQTTFSIPINASPGYYHFRVRFSDTDDMLSPWFYLNSSLLVLNNPPMIDYFDLSKFEAVIGEKIELIVNGTDVEDELSELTFEPEYKHTESMFWDTLEFDELEFIGDKYIFTFSMAPGKAYGSYNFRVTAYDSDLGYSSWKYLDRQLQVLPAPPDLLSITPSKTSIFRTEVLWVYTNCSDADSAMDELSVELHYMPMVENKWYNLSADYYETRWESYVKSKKTWSLGNYSFRARVTDWEENISPWYYLNDSLLVMNNVPEMLSVNDIPAEIFRNGSTTIKVNAKDTENAEDELNIELEYKPPGGNDWQADYLSIPVYSDNSWNINLALPADAPIGTYNFRSRVQDLDGDWSPSVYLNDSMVVRNVLPEVLSFEQTPAEVYRTESVQITASGSDLETALELLVCEIYYLEPGNINWNQLTAGFNGTSGNWNSELITNKTSKIGNYSFRVQLTDNDSASSKLVYANESVWVRNNLPVISTELDDITVGKTQYILKLTDYGYDVETSKGQLRWQIDTATINADLYHIETENIGSQEITIYPVKNKKGNDELTIVLIDSDGGRVKRTDVTIIVDSKSGNDGTTPDDGEGPFSDLTNGGNLWIILLIVIMVIIFITIFVIYYRKKRRAEEGSVLEKQAKEIAEAEATETVEPGQLPSVSEELPALDAPAPGVTTALEPPQTHAPVPVPMPEPAEPSLLPSAGEAENIECKTSALVGETKNVELKTSTGDVETEPDEALQI